MAEQKIALAMIVKNEARTIERSILAVLPIIDQIVIGIDAASDDGTREIVKRFACRMIDTRLTEELAAKCSVDGDPDWGFSKARNQVLDACDPKAWCLILDGHEVLRSKASELSEAIDKAAFLGCDGVEIKVAFDRDADGIPQIIFDSVRVLAPGVRYINPQHNAPVIKKRHSAPQIMIDHLKSEQNPADKKARDIQRADANIIGFENEVKESPGNARAWFYLGNAYRENRRHDDAVLAYERCLERSKWNEERWHSRVNAGRCLSALGRDEQARDQFVLALEEYPAMAEAYYYLADLAYRHKRYREAEAWLLKCASLPVPQCRLFLNLRVYLIDRYDLLSMVYNHTGEYLKAIEQAEIALRAAPIARIQRNIEIWREHLNKRDGTVLSLCT